MDAAMQGTMVSDGLPPGPVAAGAGCLTGR